MSEGARKGSKFIIVCTSPDVCLTPLGPTMVPVPYQIVGYLDQDACMTSDNVSFGGEPAVLVDQSMVMHVVGNEAGIGGGIKSGHNLWVVEFDEGSDNVHVNGKRVVRHGDRCWMNGRNTRGMVICTDGMGPACSIVNGRPAETDSPRASTASVQIPSPTSQSCDIDQRKSAPTDVGWKPDELLSARQTSEASAAKPSERPQYNARPTGVTIKGRRLAPKPPHFVPQVAALRQAAQLSAPYCYV